jgi:hypothetical protein
LWCSSSCQEKVFSRLIMGRAFGLAAGAVKFMREVGRIQAAGLAGADPDVPGLFGFSGF